MGIEPDSFVGKNGNAGAPVRSQFGPSIGLSTPERSRAPTLSGSKDSQSEVLPNWHAIVLQSGSFTASSATFLLLICVSLHKFGNLPHAKKSLPSC